MNYFIFIIKSAFFDFSRNKGRTFLTSLGILIGVTAVVLLLALGLGLKVYIKSQFENLGTNLLFVLPGRVLNQGAGFRPGGGTLGGVRFDEKDLTEIRKIEEVKYAVPFFLKTVRVKVKGKSHIADLRGTTAEAFTISHLSAEEGKLFRKSDVEKRTKVVVIGSKIAEKLFQETNSAVGKRITIETQGYRIVGVLKSTGNISHDFDSSVFMPYKTAYQFNQDKKFFDVHVEVKNAKEISLAKEKIKAALLKRYNEDDFSVVEQTEILGTIGSIVNVIGIFLIALGGISLLVGGIGIMNIMYVTVTERIKEIGIRRAIGARKKDILSQFLIESVILSLLGGVLGLMIAFVVVFFIRKWFPAYINFPSVVLALSVSSLIGIIFGVFPAKKAADLQPVEAIRYE